MAVKNIVHGRNSSYTAGCHCDVCRAAHAAWQLEYKARRRSGPLRAPKLGTVRRVQALVAVGWPPQELARRLGRPEEFLNRVISQNRRWVSRVDADAVKQLYDELCMTVPRGPRADWFRRKAQRLGYPSPLAWEDEDLDDPKARPNRGRKSRDADVDEAVVVRILDGDGTVARAANQAERVETARRWLAAGRPLRDLGLLTGWRPDRYAHVAGPQADARPRPRDRQGAA